MKKLDKLIIKAFMGPFIITFFIAVFVLMMQILWKYIDDLVGKGLDLLTIGRFVWYTSASLLTLAMPIAILISSIMTFGNLGESFELVAIKSSGISLLRFMRPLAVITIGLCFVTFLFANYVIPYSQLKFYTLYNDIMAKKPAFELKEGAFFNTIPGYSIRVGKKSKDGSNIYNVLIYEQSNMLQDNTITAEKGVMKMSAGNRSLEFNLMNGWRYQERGNASDSATEYVRLKFRELKKLFDMSVFQKQTTPDSLFKDNYKMLSARQLSKNLDKLEHTNDSLNVQSEERAKGLLPHLKLADSIKGSSVSQPAQIPDSAMRTVESRISSLATEIKSSILFMQDDAKLREKNIRMHELEWHRKYAFSVACLVLFFIGAPLGSIIRKGGLGMPLVVAIVFFLIFHLLNMFGEKFVKEGLLSPFAGMWLATLVLTPVGFFLTYKALHDSQLFNKELYSRLWKNTKALVIRKK